MKQSENYQWKAHLSGISAVLAVLSIMLLVVPSLKAQNIPVFAEPSVNVGFGLSGRLTANAAMVWRQQIGSFESEKFKSVSQTDVVEWQLFVNYQLLGGKRITLGYLYGLDEPFLKNPAFEHRLMQQFSFRTGSLFNGVNRVRLEQRITDDQFRNRLRYRYNFERPLSGAKIDKEEFYLVAGNELLYTFTFEAGEDHLDNRLSVGIGYLFNNGQKIQIELQHRWQRINSARQNQALHLLMAYQLKW